MFGPFGLGGSGYLNASRGNPLAQARKLLYDERADLDIEVGDLDSL
jgi:hypothetical protein